MGADVVVAQGTEAGGHGAAAGRATLPFVPVVADLAAPTPVLAAGGIADGRGLAAALVLGAAGALIGTRFQASAEALVAPEVAKALVDGHGEETERTRAGRHHRHRSRTGAPHGPTRYVAVLARSVVSRSIPSGRVFRMRTSRPDRGWLATSLVVLVGAAGCGWGSSAGGGSSSGESLADSAAQLQGHVADVWTRTGEIWPGVDFGDHVLLVTDGSETWAVTAQDAIEVSEQELDANGVSIPANPGDFMFPPDWNGQKAVVIRLEEASQDDSSTGQVDETAILSVSDPVLSTFGTATHESFHHYVQQADPPWPLNPQQGNRAEPYPLAAEPRTYRTMIYNSLLDAYREPDARPDHLAAAAYWNDRWTQEFPDEAANIPENDIKEGTAEYVERVAVWMADAEDPADSAARKEDFLDKLRPLTHRNALEVESYLLGLMAMLNSEDMGLGDAKAAVAGGATPLSMVLAGVTPTPQEPATEIVDNITAETDELNEPLAEQIDPFVDSINDPEQWALMLPSDKQKASLHIGSGGSFRTPAVPYMIMTDASQTFGLTGGTVTLEGVTVGLTSDFRYFVVPLDPGDDTVSLTGGRLELDGDHLHGSATVEAKTENGKQTLYPT